MDKIVYLVASNPGGVDGRDHTDKGGIIKFASFDKAKAESQLTGWHSLKKQVIDTMQVESEALAKLTEIENLVLGLKG